MTFVHSLFSRTVVKSFKTFQTDSCDQTWWIFFVCYCGVMRLNSHSQPENSPRNIGRIHKQRRFVITYLWMSKYPDRGAQSGLLWKSIHKLHRIVHMTEAGM